jgi:predicted dehydrogenase
MIDNNNFIGIIGKVNNPLFLEQDVTKKIAFVGCGFVADYYIGTLKNHPNLELIGVMDRDSERASKFSAYYSVPVYSTLEQLLSDPKVDIVVNLTNPSSHFTISKACLEAGKHVYSEKPLSMELSEAKELVEFANKNGLYLSSAPCGLLGETAQTIWKALKNQAVGKVHVVYAEIDDSPIHLEQPNKWFSQSGAPWPYKDEFEVGCTLEHAGYYLTWFPAFFGPANKIAAFSTCLIPNKQILENEALTVNTPDFSVACITFESGVVVRLTCSIVAPYNHSMQIVGEKGILSIDECWNYYAPVYINKYSKLGFRAEKYPLIRKSSLLKTLLGIHPKPYPFIKKSNFKLRNLRHYQDFSRGIAELAQAIIEKRRCRIPADYALHVNEMVLAIQNAFLTGTSYQMTTTFEPIG